MMTLRMITFVPFFVTKTTNKYKYLRALWSNLLQLALWLWSKHYIQTLNKVDLTLREKREQKLMNLIRLMSFKTWVSNLLVKYIAVNTIFPYRF